MDAINRLRFHTALFLKKMRLQLDELVHPKRSQETLGDDTFYVPTPKELAEIEKILQEHRDSEPKLDPRRTMIFHSRPEEHRCNAATASLCRCEILRARKWAHQHGITTFLADYTTPFGLLALETLVELREAGEDFRVYAVKSNYFTERKTYRIVPETGIEIAFLTARSDYSYCGTPERIIRCVLPNAATCCSEQGIWISKEKLPPYLLDAWQGN